MTPISTGIWVIVATTSNTALCRPSLISCLQQVPRALNCFKKFIHAFVEGANSLFAANLSFVLGLKRKMDLIRLPFVSVVCLNKFILIKLFHQSTTKYYKILVFVCRKCPIDPTDVTSCNWNSNFITKTWSLSLWEYQCKSKGDGYWIGKPILPTDIRLQMLFLSVLLRFSKYICEQIEQTVNKKQKE